MSLVRRRQNYSENDKSIDNLKIKFQTNVTRKREQSVRITENQTKPSETSPKLSFEINQKKKKKTKVNDPKNLQEKEKEKERKKADN